MYTVTVEALIVTLYQTWSYTCLKTTVVLIMSYYLSVLCRHSDEPFLIWHWKEISSPSFTRVLSLGPLEVR